MPYFEIGTPVDFTAAEEKPLTAYALQGQILGVVSTQGVAYIPIGHNLIYFVSFSATQMQSIKNVIEQRTGATVKYARISWNLTGTTLTDLVIGVVVEMKAPNSGQDIINALRHVLYLGDVLHILSWKAYVLGSPATGTYHYEQTVDALTTEIVPLTALIEQWGTEQTALETVKNAFVANIQNSIHEGYAQNGIPDVNVLTIDVISYSFEKMMYVLSTGQRAVGAKFHIKFKVVFDTAYALQGSPIAPLVLAAIILAIKIVALAAVAAFTIYLVIEWFKSMTTSTVTSRKYDWVLNPNTGEYEWKLVSDETVTNPDVGGIFSVGTIIAIVVSVGLLIVLGMFATRTKK